MQMTFKSSLELVLSLPKKVFAWLLEDKFRRMDLLVLAVYGVIVSFGIWHHEPWGDEAYPWIIARDADWRTFLEILFTNRDRHPGLFYLVILPWVKLGLPYIAQGILNLLFALGAAFLWLKRAPFSRVFRYLFLFSFYMLYEYAVITRNYMMSLLILFAIAMLYPKRTERPLVYAILVAFLLHADFMCLGLGLGLTAVFAWEHRNKFAGNRPLIFSMVLMTLSALLVLWIAHALPLDHPARGRHLPFSVSQCLVPVSKAFLPFFNDSQSPGLPLLAMLGSFAAFFLSWIALLRKPVPLVILGCALAPLFYIFNFVDVGDYRHYGFILISILFTLWIAESYREPQGTAPAVWPRRARAAAIALMCAFFFVGLRAVNFIYMMEYKLPFSGSREAANAVKLLEKRYGLLSQGFTVVAKNANAISLMPYLPGVKFWNPCTRSFARYYYNNKALAACTEVPSYEAVLRTKAAWGEISKAIFLFNAPLPVSEDADYRYENFFTSRKGFGYTYETFYFYRAIPKGVPASPARQAAR